MYSLVQNLCHIRWTSFKVLPCVYQHLKIFDIGKYSPCSWKIIEGIERV